MISPQETLQSIVDRLHRQVVDFGFLGDANTPVVVDYQSTPIIVKHNLKHAHDLNGVCVKSRYGFCEEL